MPLSVSIITQRHTPRGEGQKSGSTGMWKLGEGMKAVKIIQTEMGRKAAKADSLSLRYSYDTSNRESQQARNPPRIRKCQIKGV